MNLLENIGKKAKEASYELANLNTEEKNKILLNIKNTLNKRRNEIIKANKIDIENGKKAGLSEGLLDRLLLNDDRVDGMLDSIDTVIGLDDPIGEVSDMKKMLNGLEIGKRRVAIGVIAIIYEARPNVTLDCSILCLKSSNSLILRGGKEAINSNMAIVKIIRDAIEELNYDKNIVQLIEDTTRESSNELMKLNKYVDMLIPRGSANLINHVVKNSTVPVLQTGNGNCHIFVDDTADIDMAIAIIENAKTQRIGVCNAMESLLVSEKVDKEFFGKLNDIIEKYNITVYGCEKSKQYLPNIKDATENEYAMEYLDYAFSMKIVKDIDEAISHIRKYSTKHSEAIITNDYNNSMKFLNLVDSSCVYVNASTRFTDGGEFGFGAEMGISTQKLHARGPVGLKELTSEKYVILGNGQIRK
ncbi:MAG: glutamate-5-semialdehyde dehydrogenase [Tissierellia bacterium]|nr:glutamate-5-semialdehyde dehydrogenase [Tissierellia bacterium]